MDTSFVQIFDKEDDAVEAIGNMSRGLPNHKHILTRSHQVQVWAKIAGVDDVKTYGAPNPSLIFLVTSIAPEG